MYRAGQRFVETVIFSNVANSGIAVNTAGLPSGYLTRNGVDDLTVQIWVNNIDGGRYIYSGIIPSTYNQFDVVQLYVSGYLIAGAKPGLVKEAYDFGPLDCADWTINERQQIKYKLGMDASTYTSVVSPTGTQLANIELSTSGLQQIVIETGMNAREALVGMAAILCGVSSGTAGSIWYNGINNPNQNRVYAVSTSGIRSSLAYTLP
jgi:hypothetical protein